LHSRIALLLLPLLLATGPAQAKRGSADAAYEGARKAYYVLKGDAARRKLRHHWLNVARRFEGVTSRYPKSERAPEALFTAAELLTELSRISLVEEDLKAAIADYAKMREKYPKHRLSDDAALALAKIYVHRLDQPENARRVITEALATHPKGDQARDLKQLLAALPAPPKPAPARKSPAKGGDPSAPAVAEVAPDERPSGAGVVDAITRLAREPSPFALNPQAPVATAEAVKPAPAAPATVEAVAVAPVAKPSREVPPGASETKTLDALVASVTAARAAESKPAPEVVPEEPPRPITAPVDEKVAQARLKAMVKDTRRAELSLVEQLGLKVRRIVIDPGHGGHDTGAIGKKGTREKDVALAISQKVAAQLRESGLEVLLTREDDRFIRLEDRARFANEARGDLFISIHCNSAPSRKLRGVETYTLNTSADRYSIRLAARENASSEKGISDLQFILADLATKANTEESSRLATHVQKSLVSTLGAEYSGIKNLGTKEALFYVLLGAKMPAILVETSFLSHAEEEQRLASEAYQEDVARSIAQGVEEFLGDRHRVAKVN
jgi:N-acetylmuramoyl-L-alanine amidase